MIRALVALLVLTAASSTQAAPPSPASSTQAAPPSAVTLTYLGVAGWTISDGKHRLVIDPYFSRPTDSKHPVSDAAALARYAPPLADLVLVGHAHYDHDLDAPALARRTGAPLLGSAELTPKARAAGLPDKQIVQVKGGEDLQFDGFSVRVIPSLHSMTGFQNGGDVQTFAYLVRIGGQSILVFDTANFIEHELDGIHPDVAIIATGLRDQIYDYSCRLMRVLGRPRRVLTTHFDDFHAPVGTPIDAATQADLAQLTREIKRCAPATEVIVPKPFVAIPAR